MSLWLNSISGLMGNTDRKLDIHPDSSTGINYTKEEVRPVVATNGSFEDKKKLAIRVFLSVSRKKVGRCLNDEVSMHV